MRINNKQPIRIDEEKEWERREEKNNMRSNNSNNRPTHEIIKHLWKWTEEKNVTSNPKQQNTLMISHRRGSRWGKNKTNKHTNNCLIGWEKFKSSDRHRFAIWIVKPKLVTDYHIALMRCIGCAPLCTFFFRFSCCKFCTFDALTPNLIVSETDDAVGCCIKSIS